MAVPALPVGCRLCDLCGTRTHTLTVDGRPLHHSTNAVVCQRYPYYPYYTLPNSIP